MRQPRDRTATKTWTESAAASDGSEEAAHRSTWWAVGAALLAVVCYANTLPNDYCYDDVPIVRESAKVRAPGQWRLIWTTDYWSEIGPGWRTKDLLYRPATISSYRLVHRLAGAEPWPQHLLNVLLHGVISATVVVLAMRLGLGSVAGGIAGAIFAVLPIHNEAVASIVGRADLLATGGVLGALIAYDAGRKAPHRRHAWCWWSLAAAAAFLALASKESGAVVVPVMLAWALLQPRSAGSRGAGRLPSVVRLLPVLMLPVAAYLVLRWIALDGELVHQAAITKTVNWLVDSPPWQRALGAVQLWGMYWSKTIAPWMLSVGYSVNSLRPAATFRHADVLIGVVAAAALLTLVLWAWRRGQIAVGFVAAALILSYLPTSNVLSLIQVYFAERLWYLPSVWAAILLGWIAAMVWRRRIVQVAVLVIVIGFAGRTALRNAEWRDNGTLFAAAFRDQPDGAQPLYLYGQWLVADGQLEAGAILLRRALAIDIGFTDAHRALGQALLRLNRLDEAVHHLQTAEMQGPGEAQNRQALRQARQELAVRDSFELAALRDAAESRPLDVQAQLALVEKLRDLGDVEAALQHLAQHDHRFADEAIWQAEYAVTLVMAGRLDDAVQRYAAAIEVAPGDAQRLTELAMLLLQRRAEGDLDSAASLSRRAIELAPDSPTVLAGRAEALAILGDIHAAQQTYRRAIANSPVSSEQRRMYEQRLRALGE